MSPLEYNNTESKSYCQKHFTFIGKTESNEYLSKQINYAIVKCESTLKGRRVSKKSGRHSLFFVSTFREVLKI